MCTCTMMFTYICSYVHECIYCTANHTYMLIHIYTYRPQKNQHMYTYNLYTQRKQKTGYPSISPHSFCVPSVDAFCTEQKYAHCLVFPGSKVFEPCMVNIHSLYCLLKSSDPKYHRLNRYFCSSLQRKNK